MRTRLPLVTALRIATVTALAASLLAACGGSDSSDGAAASATASATPSAGDDTASDATLAKPEKLFFAADSPWNTSVDGATVDPDSATLLQQAKESVGVLEQKGDDLPLTEYRTGEQGIYVNTTRWTTPVVRGGQSTVMTCRQADCGDTAPGGRLAVPADVDPDPRYDGWFSIIDKSGKYVYDLWRARREGDDSISYQYMRRWSLNGPGYLKPQEVSARGSGLPLVGGLIRPGELEAGEIAHALAISVPGAATGTFVQPASSTDGIGRTTSLPEGARIRLKADVVLRRGTDPATGKKLKLTAQQRRVGDAIVAALRTYGAIVVDRAAVPTLYAQRDATASLLVGNELQGLTLDDFEVVTRGTAYAYPATDLETGN